MMDFLALLTLTDTKILLHTIQKRLDYSISAYPLPLILFVGVDSGFIFRRQNSKEELLRLRKGPGWSTNNAKQA